MQDDSFLDPSAPLLTRERAAEHVLHAIANGRCDLLTPGVLNLLGPAKVEESAEAVASWEFAGHCFLQSGACAVLGAAAVVMAPLEIPTLLFGGAAAVAMNLPVCRTSSKCFARRHRCNRLTGWSA